MALAAPDLRYREATKEWLAKNDVDIAASFLLPKALMVRLSQTQARADEITLSGLLRRYFNKLDRRVFKSAHRRHGMRVERIVTLERTDAVGWHAHVLLKTPVHMSRFTFRLLMQRLWLKEIKGFADQSRIQARLFWAEPISGNYLDYSTKHVGRDAQVDWMNIVRSAKHTSA